MLSIARRIAAGTGLLLIMPLLVLLFGWHWQPGGHSGWLQMLYWITETVTQPWGIITHVVLCGWFLWCLRFRLKAALTLFTILGVAIVIGQGVKSWVKTVAQEPRPFVVWLEKTHQIPVDEFYTLKRKERGALVQKQLTEQDNVPEFLRKHWQKETGFAFPSGHTMFAASWALLAVGLLWPRRRTLTIVVLMVWAVLVMGSRLLLGMHWPQDLAVATLISGILVTLATWLAQRLCGPLTPPVKEDIEIAQREEKNE
ncbi:phosphatidylglycerophosphatase B [Pseudescherichia vulneris NBRC 102420]|uniref:undecaprenyl-diphosphate phosphatase n=1 Tax=Pseudescherichia vulneris NBRC 102420 TaxID=1115515 RepID=A0A090V4W5_PSEVU|nr:phosphatidylglycerophosphatase B [Pseudescherichia vulneris]GAL59846.1 phosphatidylglycerophosphatase B [Pseudescherichia vulneris NBRC 102420]STQ60219.1 phosphatidylglycerophosphatase B [Pseudescherichia vulneris]